VNQQESLAAKGGRSVTNCLLAYARPLPFVLLLFTFAVPAVTFAAQSKPQSAAKTAVKKRHRLRITKGGAVVGLSLKADKARMSDVAVDLAKGLGTRVIVGPSLAKQRITVEFADLTLETALRLMAPHAYVDYELRANAQPAIVAIFLNDLEDSDPAKNASVQSSSEAFLIEGNTEDADPSAAQNDDNPLQVDLDDESLTIRSNKQLLAAVVLTVGYVLEVPVDIKYDSNEIIDTTIKDTPYEDAVLRLSPNVRLYVRADLTRSQRTPLRLSVVAPPKVVDTGTN
jgi:ABC-type Na+ efflux pump permease subunit